MVSFVSQHLHLAGMQDPSKLDSVFFEDVSIFLQICFSMLSL